MAKKLSKDDACRLDYVNLSALGRFSYRGDHGNTNAGKYYAAHLRE
jgi:hypothetical protein